MSSIQKIQRYGLCLGCGLCQSVSDNKVHMILNSDGFNHPDPINAVETAFDNAIAESCPGINLFFEKEPATADKIWGSVERGSARSSFTSVALSIPQYSEAPGQEIQEGGPSAVHDRSGAEHL